MRPSRRKLPCALYLPALYAALLCCAASGAAQTSPAERTFRAAKQTVEKALEQLQPAMHGRLPALEGFAVPGEHPLSQYRRAFYQCTAQVSTAPSGESVVRVSAKVTAWYADGTTSHSGYELLQSNGRLEADVLDQLSDQLATAGSSAGGESPVPAKAASPPTPRVEPSPWAPLPRSRATLNPFGSATAKGSSHSAVPGETASLRSSLKRALDLQSDDARLQEVLQNQAYPKNLVAVKKSGTPVAASPNPEAKTLFLASTHDEFELLDFTATWVHVRISGLSRGWIRRASLEMPEGVADVPKAADRTSVLTANDLFQVSREETAPFPGEWAPLRGKKVKIVSVQEVQEDVRHGGAAKLEFAKSVIYKRYEEMSKSPDLSGLVLIFDAADGGMIAATIATIQSWKAGALTDAALWHQCYFDPPGAFGVGPVAGKR